MSWEIETETEPMLHLEFNDFTFDFGAISNAENAFEWSTLPEIPAIKPQEQDPYTTSKVALKNGNSTLSGAMPYIDNDLLKPLQKDDLRFLNVRMDADRSPTKRTFTDAMEDPHADVLPSLLSNDHTDPGLEFNFPAWGLLGDLPRPAPQAETPASQVTTVRNSPVSTISSRLATPSPSPKSTFRRQQHQVSERKRRAVMKNDYDVLSELVPSLTVLCKTKKKVTNVQKLEESTFPQPCPPSGTCLTS